MSEILDEVYKSNEYVCSLIKKRNTGQRIIILNYNKRFKAF